MTMLFYLFFTVPSKSGAKAHPTASNCGQDLDEPFAHRANLGLYEIAVSIEWKYLRTMGSGGGDVRENKKKIRYGILNQY